MKCAEVQAQLSAFLDGELAPSAAEAVARHVDACGRCALRCEQLQKVKELLDAGTVPEKIDLAERIMERVAAEEAPAHRHSTLSGRRFRVRVWAAAAAAVIAAALVVHTVFLAEPEKSQVSEIVDTAGSLFQGMGEAFAEAGRGITVVPEKVVDGAKEAWLNIAVDTPARRLPEVLGRGGSALIGSLSGVGDPLGAVRSFLVSPERSSSGGLNQ